MHMHAAIPRLPEEGHEQEQLRGQAPALKKRPRINHPAALRVIVEDYYAELPKNALSDSFYDSVYANFARMLDRARARALLDARQVPTVMDLD